METEEELKNNPDGRDKHHRRNSYSAAMEEENAIVESDEHTRRQSVATRWKILNSEKKMTSEESHDSTSSSLSSSASIRPGRSRNVTRTPSSSATSRSSSMNEIELAEVSVGKSRVIARQAGYCLNRDDEVVTDCSCRKDSLTSTASPRDSFSSYSIKRQDSGYSVSTCQSTLPPSSAKNSVTTLNAWQESSKLHQQANSGTSFRPTVRRHSDQTFLPRCHSDTRRLSDQSLIRHALRDSAVVRSMPLRTSRRTNKISATKSSIVTSSTKKPPLQEYKRNNNNNNNMGNAVRFGRPNLARRDSDASIQSSRRDSLEPVTPKIVRRRFSEQLILEGGFGNELEFDDLLVATYDDNDPEESLTVANARKKVTLKRHYYPEGDWGYVVTVVAVIVHSICHGLQMGFGVLLLSTMTRFDKKPDDAGSGYKELVLTRKEVFLIISEHLSDKFASLIEFMVEKISKDTGRTVVVPEDSKQTFSILFNQMRTRWQQAHRKSCVFFKNNSDSDSDYDFD